MKSKKLQDYRLVMPDGVAYMLSVMAESERHGNIYSTFSISLPWEITVSAPSVTEAIEKAKAEAIKQGSHKKEKIIAVSIDGENNGWGDIPKDESATLALNFMIGFKALRHDGKYTYHDQNGKQSYNYGWGRDEWTELPWTQEREDALHAAVASLHKTRATVQRLVKSESFVKCLDGKKFLALPE